MLYHCIHKAMEAKREIKPKYVSKRVGLDKPIVKTKLFLRTVASKPHIPKTVNSSSQPSNKEPANAQIGKSWFLPTYLRTCHCLKPYEHEFNHTIIVLLTRVCQYNTGVPPGKNLAMITYRAPPDPAPEKSKVVVSEQSHAKGEKLQLKVPEVSGGIDPDCNGLKKFDKIPTNVMKPAKASFGGDLFGPSESTSELPPNYFDRKAKGIVIQRKEKDFTIKTQYATRDTKSAGTEELVEKVEIQKEEVQYEDWEIFLNSIPEVDRYMKSFVELIKMERKQFPKRPKSMSTNFTFFLKLPEMIKAIMKKVVERPEMEGLYDTMVAAAALRPKENAIVNDTRTTALDDSQVDLSNAEHNREKSGILDEIEDKRGESCIEQGEEKNKVEDVKEFRLHYEAFKELVMEIETRIHERVAPPVVSFEVVKPKAKKIPVAITVRRATSVVAFLTTKVLTGEESWYDNFDLMHQGIGTVVAAEKLDLVKSDEDENFAVTLVGHPKPLQKDTEYFVYVVASHPVSLTGRPSRESNTDIVRQGVLTKTAARKEVTTFLILYFLR